MIQDGDIDDLRQRPADDFVQPICRGAATAAGSRGMIRAYPRAGAVGLGLVSAGGFCATPVRIGSKQFTESVVLGEVARGAARQAGIEAIHRASSAARVSCGERCATATSTSIRNTPARSCRNCCTTCRPTPASSLYATARATGHRHHRLAGLQQHLRPRHARGRGANSWESPASPICAHPELDFGFSNEFLDRDDGWPGLRARYALAAEGRARPRPRSGLPRAGQRRHRRHRSVHHRCGDPVLPPA